MRQQIKKLEKQARLLDPDATIRKIETKNVLDYTEAFLNEIHTRNVFKSHDGTSKKINGLLPDDKGISLNEVINIFNKYVSNEGIMPASGGHMGFIPGGGLYHAALGDFLAAVTNLYAGVFFASPGAIRLENTLIRWMCGLADYDNKSAGNLTSGGSVANLIGIVTAREASGIKATDFHRSVIYLTEQVHHSVFKSIAIAGLKEAIIRKIPIDDNFKMNFPELEKAIKQDKGSGSIPMLLISSAGTTDTGVIDPLDEISSLCIENNIWHHVDAAYGGFFLLSSLVNDRFKGIGRSDSITIDPHKGMFMPYGLGALLVRNGETLFEAHNYTANYMQDTHSFADEYSPADLSPEMSKHFRGLRMWLPLMTLGLKPFKAALDEKILLTRYFHDQLKNIPGFETGPDPELSVSTFRFVPENGDANEFNRKLVEEIHRDGRVFLSSTNINGIFTLRLAVLHFRTHLSTIDLTLEILKEKSAKLVNK